MNGAALALIALLVGVIERLLRGGGSGEVSEVLWNSPAFEVGIVAGATLVSVDDDKYDPEKLLAAIQGESRRWQSDQARGEESQS
jgi:hypothetical protein